MSNEVENTGKILIYQNEKGDTKIDVYFEEDTIWMTQKAMCELYQVAKSSVSEHISNIFKDGELEPRNKAEPLQNRNRKKYCLLTKSVL